MVVVIVGDSSINEIGGAVGAAMARAFDQPVTIMSHMASNVNAILSEVPFLGLAMGCGILGVMSFHGRVPDEGSPSGVEETIGGAMGWAENRVEEYRQGENANFLDRQLPTYHTLQCPRRESNPRPKV
jgi:hypothetical protein